MKKIILDTSALVEGIVVTAREDFEYYITSSVLKELESKLEPAKVEMLESLGVRKADPSVATLRKVEGIVSLLGETPRLSKVDIDILALAIELNATILTDDYSIQNVAEEIGIKCLAFAQKGITKKIIWKYQCVGCNKYFQNFLKTCPICGHRIKTVR
ncbi:MAG: PIN domain-containing protein [Candidatus Thermoplasmatota archaeon]